MPPPLELDSDGVSEYMDSCQSDVDHSCSDSLSDDDFGVRDVDPLEAASRDKVTDDDVAEVADQIDLFNSDPSELPFDEEELFDGNVHPPEYYQRNIKSLNVDDYDRKEYSPGTESLIAMAQKQWRLYDSPPIRIEAGCKLTARSFCSKVLQKNWKKSFETVDFCTIYNFLDWSLHQKLGHKGRAKRGLRKRSSLVTFWCTFRLAFERATTLKIDEFVERKRMHNALVELGNKHGLGSDKRENRTMTLNDLKLQIDTTLRTTAKSFKVGEQRILAALFLLLLAPAGSRPASILQLRFGDIRICLVRDPHQGPHRLVIKFTLNFTKRYLGAKAAKTFLIPEIIYDPSLLLSPHVFLLALLFRHRAFRAENLNNNPHALADLDIYEGEHELPLPLKAEFDDVYVFRRAEQDPAGGFTMSESQHISSSMMTAWVKRIGELLGFEYTTICYSLRYAAGNNLDGNVSDALRNLVMDHAPNSETFQKHYLSRNICVDIYAHQRASDPQEALLAISTSHGHSRSSRRPANLTSEQSASLKNHPSIVGMTARLHKLRVRSPEYRALRLKIKATKAKLFNTKKEAIRKEWTAKQAVEDIDRQIGGPGLAPVPQQTGRPTPPAQQRLMTALTAPLVGTDMREQFNRRAAAIDAIIAYCTVDEPLSTKILEANKPEPPPELQSAQNMTLSHEQLRASVRVHKRGERLRRCFLCVGKALTLPPDDPNITALCWTYSVPASVTRHFRSVHLSKLGDDARTVCPICPTAKLKGKMHLQNHADVVHGIRTDFRLL